MIQTAIPLLHVSDSISAEKFYCDQLGFKKVFAYRPFGGSDPCYFGIMRDAAYIHVSSFPGDGKAGGVINLKVDNVDAYYNEFVAKAVRIDMEPVDQSWGNREMYIKDQDNNSIRFQQDSEGS